MSGRLVLCGWVLFIAALAFAARGVAGDGVVALQTAAPACPDNSSDRYVDCGNGTVTDNDTGLVWVANANCFGLLNWHDAMAAVAGLADLPVDTELCVGATPDECDCGLSDGSSPGEWRLPSAEEWAATVKYARDVIGCANPPITDDIRSVCWTEQCAESGPCSFYNVQVYYYWSSSPWPPTPGMAGDMNLSGGNISPSSMTTTSYVWPVRGGQ